MAKISLAGFKDPVRRPRYIMWTGAVVLLLAAFVVTALGVTSTYWFCAEVCHKVQDDSIAAYNRSTHSQVSCMACHVPVGITPIGFVLKKAEALGELYLTATNNFELPLNPGSHLALSNKYFPEKQCTQCHNLANRTVTPSPGIIIDHDVHSEAEIWCTVCHNRVGHNEDGLELVLIDPQSGQPNQPHDDFMLMTACFRCHTLTDESPGGIPAPGECGACHTPDFELKPSNHFVEDFYPRGHADMALDDLEAQQAARGEAPADDAVSPEGDEGDADTEEGTEESALGISKAYAAGDGELDDDAPMYKLIEHLPAPDAVGYCSTCHVEAVFCMDCHGMEMPHPVEFRTATHPELVATAMDKCVMCHTEADPYFCDSCHHGTESDWEFQTDVAWEGEQHAAAVRQNGVPGCLGQCHEISFCQDCHTALNPLPTSHEAADWLIKPSPDLGVHAVSAKAEITACEVCHGDGGPNSDFCKACHVLDMPHPQDFKEFHAATGRQDPDVCANCHTYVELCSDCHHEGAIDGRPWLRVHADVVNDMGGESCFGLCHNREFCVDCHNDLTVLPSSHEEANFTARVDIDTPADHPIAYNERPENCTYCHGEGGVEAKFCVDCHRIEIPHPADFKDTHASGFQEGELTHGLCTGCHVQLFCDRCHHEGVIGAQPWTLEHPAVVRETGAHPCFECHEPTSCAQCHVGLSRQ